MKQKYSNARDQRSVQCLAGMSGMALILGLVNVAVGQTTTIKIDSVPAVTISTPAAGHSEETDQVETGDTSAIADKSGFSSKPAAGAIDAVDNQVSASATAISSAVTLDVATLTGTRDFSVATGQANIGKVDSKISGEPLVEIIFGDNKTVGAVTVSGNTAQASTTINRSDIGVTHSGLDAFGSGTAGSAITNGNGSKQQIKATADGVLATYQKTQSSASSARVSNSGILVDVHDGKNLSSTDISIVENRIGATFVANDADSAYAASDSALSLDGSVVIANLQDNGGASSTTSGIASVIGSGIIMAAEDLAINSPVTVSDNALMAGASGNQAANSLSLIGLNVTGDSGATLSVPPMTGTKAEVKGVNLGIASAQRNLDASLRSRISGSDIWVQGGSGNGTGDITLGNNTALAQTTGNAVENAIGVQVTHLDEAGFAIASNQVNRNTTIKADNQTRILVGAEGTGTDPDAMAHRGSVVLAGNSVVAQAQGSVADNAMSIGTDTAGTADMILRSRQVSRGDSSLSASAGGDIGARLEGKIDVDVLENRIASTAITNTAANAIALEGAGIYGLILRNYQDAASPTTATTRDARIVVVTDDLASGSRVAVNGNTVSSQAGGNDALNKLEADSPVGLALSGNSELKNTQSVSEAVRASTSGHALFLASGTLGSKDTADVLDNTITAIVFGNNAGNVVGLDAETSLDIDSLTLTSTQTVGDDVSASTKGRILIGDQDGTTRLGTGLAIAGTAVVKGNELFSHAVSNEVSNAIAMRAGTSAAGTAKIENTQTANGNTTASTSTGQAGMSIVAQETKGITGKAVLANNTVASDAVANRADNAIDIAAQTGTAISPDLANTQTNIGRVSATTTVAGLGVAAAGPISGTATVSGNALSATARANLADNSIALVFSDSVNGSPFVNNTQTNKGRVIASLIPSGTQGGLGITAGGKLSGTAAVSNNKLSSTALGSQATNDIVLNALNAVGTSDATIENDQSNTEDANITSSIKLDHGLGIHSNTDIAGATTTVSGNVVDSLAAANHADNSIGQSGLIADAMTSKITNAQDNNAAVKSTVAFGDSGSVGVSTYGPGPTGKMSNTTVNLVNNAVSARAFGNSAANVLNATVSADALTSAQSGTSTQTNSGAITAAINGPTDSWAGRVFDIRTGPENGGSNTFNIANNSIAAVAYGNTVFNQLTASSLLGAATASQSLSSSQTNSGRVTASVTNAGMGVMGSNAGNRTVIAGNSISATAVGNAAVSSMVIGY